MAGQALRVQVPAGAVHGSVVQFAADGNGFHCRLPEHSFPGQELFIVASPTGSLAVEVDCAPRQYLATGNAASARPRAGPLHGPISLYLSDAAQKC